MIRKLNYDKEDITFETIADTNKLKGELSTWGIANSKSKNNIDRALNAIKTLNGKIPK